MVSKRGGILLANQDLRKNPAQKIVAFFGGCWGGVTAPGRTNLSLRLPRKLSAQAHPAILLTDHGERYAIGVVSAEFVCLGGE